MSALFKLCQWLYPRGLIFDSFIPVKIKFWNTAAFHSTSSLEHCSSASCCVEEHPLSLIQQPSIVRFEWIYSLRLIQGYRTILLHIFFFTVTSFQVLQFLTVATTIPLNPLLRSFSHLLAAKVNLIRTLFIALANLVFSFLLPRPSLKCIYFLCLNIQYFEIIFPWA